MDIAIFLSGPLALLGVWLGGLLSSRAQDRAWRREERRLWRDTRRIAYGRFVAAVRQYRTYVTGPHARVEVWRHPDGRRLVPGIGPEGASYQAGMEAAFAEVQILAEDQETVDRAHLLTSIARRLAVARAVHGAGSVPAKIDDGLFIAERNFVNCARRGLGLPNVGPPSPFHQEVARMDTDLLSAYRDHATMPRDEG